MNFNHHAPVSGTSTLVERFHDIGRVMFEHPERYDTPFSGHVCF